MKSIGDRETRLAEQDVDGKGRGGGWSKVDDGDRAKVTGEVLWEPKAAGPVFRANGGTLRSNGGGGETQRTRSISAQDGGGIGAWSKEDDDGWAKVTREVLWEPKATGPVFRASGGALRGNGGGGERQRTWSISAQDGGGIGAWSKEDDGGAWANLSGEVLWDHKSLGNVELEQQKWQPKLQDNEEASCSMISDLKEENWQLKQKCCQLELLIKKMNAEKKRTDMIHRLEIRWRDKKEMGFVIAVCVAALLHVVFALTRAFV